MRLFIAGLLFLSSSWVGSFGIAVGVVEWRGGETIIERQIDSGLTAAETRLRTCEAALGGDVRLESIRELIDRNC